MQHYELLYIISAQYTEKELVPLINKVTDLVKKKGGIVIYEESLGRKKLAYPIKHIHQGYYFLIEFDSTESQLKELEANLKLTPEVLRYLIIKRKVKTLKELREERERLERRISKEEKVEARPEDILSDREKTKIGTKKKISLEELDKKLDEILKETDVA